MGRGLSTLQKDILRLAAAKHAEHEPERKQGKLPRGAADLIMAEILAELYHWPMIERRWPSKQAIRHGGQNFSRRDISPQAYNVAHVVVTKSLERLAKRGLIELCVGANALWLGLRITEAGMGLTAKTTPNVTEL